VMLEITFCDEMGCDITDWCCLKLHQLVELSRTHRLCHHSYSLPGAHDTDHIFNVMSSQFQVTDNIIQTWTFSGDGLLLTTILLDFVDHFVCKYCSIC